MTLIDLLGRVIRYRSRPPAHTQRTHPQKSGSWSEAKLNAYATKIVETLEKAGRNISLG